MKYTLEKSLISYDFAAALIKKALEHAQDIQLPISVAIVDSIGNLVAFARMDDASLISIGTSKGKAFTAARGGLDTEGLADFLKANNVDTLSLQDEKLVLIGGGSPLFIRGNS